MKRLSATDQNNTGLLNVPDPSLAQDAANKRYTDKLRTVTRTVGPAGSGAYYECDGTADEVQINDAISDVNSLGGGVVRLLAGTYTTAASIVLLSNVVLEGEGIGSTIITGASSDYSLANTTKSGTTKTVYTGITVRNITFQSNYGTCLDINNTNGVRVSGCEFTFTVTTPIRQTLFIQHCQQVVVTNNNAHDYTGNGLSVTSTDYFTVANNLVTGGSNGDDGIDIDFDFLDTSAIPSNYGTVTGNVVRTIGRGNGIRIENSNYVTVGDNAIDGVASTSSIAGGIMVNTTSTNTATGISVSANTVTNCVPGGVAVTGSGLTNVIVDNNLLYNCGQDGGSVRGGIILNAASVNCVGNTIDTTAKTGTDGAGILIYETDGHTVRNNVVTNSVTGIRAWNGDGAQSYASSVVVNNKLGGNTTDVVLSAFTATSQEFGNFGQASYANSLNQLAISNAATGSNPQLAAVGPDTNIGMLYLTKGTGRHIFRPGTNATNVFSVQNAAATSTILDVDTTNSRVGIGTATPSSTFTINGSFGVLRTSVADVNHAATSPETIIAYTSLTAARTVTLPTAVNIAGRLYVIKDETGSAATYNISVATTSSQTIDGATSKVVADNYGWLVLYSDGANWKVWASSQPLPRRVVPLTVASNTYTINLATTDEAVITSAPSANFTVTTTGTPYDGQKVWLIIASGTTGYTPTWNAIFTSSGVATLPSTALPASKTVTFAFRYNANVSKFVLMAADTTGY